jgi:ABC-type transport system involved in multi-copper enzyme maturation permease subunit
LATAGEFQHRTVRTTLLQAPRRGRVLAAKAAVLAAYGALLAAVGSLSATVTGAITMGSRGLSLGFSLDAWGALAGCVLIGGLWAVFAAGLGLLVRSSTVALVTVLLWTFVVENVIPMVTNTPELRRLMPSSAAVSVIHGGASSSYVAPLVGAVLFVGYTAVILLAGSVSFLRRDPA